MYQEDPIVLLEQLLETFTVLDAQGVVRSQSPWFERILGYKQGQLAGKSVFSYIHPDDLPLVEEAFAKVVHTPGATAAAEFRFQHRDGSWHALQVAGKSLVSGSGETQIVVSARNVTERKRTEEALRESEEKYRDLVENINDAIFTQDENGIFTYVSPVIEALSGYRPEELVGRPFTNFISPEDLPALLESFHRTLAGHLEPSEFRAISKSGELRWLRSSSRPIRKGDKVVGLRGVLTDISEQKGAEQRAAILLEVAKDISGTFNLQELLARIERRAAAALACQSLSTFFWDERQNLFRMVSQYGFSEIDLPSPDERCFPSGEVFHQVADGQPFVFHTTLASWLEGKRGTETLAAPLIVRGRLRGLLLARATESGRGFDREQLELCDGIARQLAVGIEAVELYQAQQEEIAISSSLARAGRELIVSLETPAILQRLCRLTEELLAGHYAYVVLWRRTEGEFCQVIFSGDGAQETPEMRMSFKISHALVADIAKRFGEEEVMELTLGELSQLWFDRDAPPHDVAEAMCLALRQGRDLIGFHIVGYRHRLGVEAGKLRIAHGVSQIASVALANARLLEELDHANRLKQDFVGTVSHELRTPLNVILGYNDLLREGAFGKLSGEQESILHRINKSATQLLDLINSTLDLSRLQSQDVLAAVASLNIPELFAELETEFRPVHKNSFVTLEWRSEPGLPPLRTDPVKLKMILKNLIGNALKFTHEGKVSTIASTKDGGVEFLVRDTGIGIPPDAHALVFEPFRQVDGSTTRMHGGVGLGLYIVRQLLELLGGTVSLESEVGKGSMFRVWVPYQRDSQQQVLGDQQLV